jgi:hypothetical protein
VHPHRLGLALGAPFASAVLEIPTGQARGLKAHDQFLLLGVDRDGRLAGRLKAAHLGIDVFELGIAIGVAGPFARLAVGLKREAEMPQQPADQLMADHEAALGQRAGEMTLALADPQQRRLRITPNGRLDELAKRFQQSGVPVDRRLASAAGAANSAAEMVLAAAQLGQSAADGATSHRGRRAHRLDPAATRRQRLARRNHSPPALVKERRDGLKARFDGGDIDHRLKIPTSPLLKYLYLDSFIAFFP